MGRLAKILWEKGENKITSVVEAGARGGEGGGLLILEWETGFVRKRPLWVSNLRLMGVAKDGILLSVCPVATVENDLCNC